MQETVINLKVDKACSHRIFYRTEPAALLKQCLFQRIVLEMNKNYTALVCG